MRVRVTCVWRSTLATQEDLPPVREGEPLPEPRWGSVGAVVEGRLIRLRHLNSGYANVGALEDGLQVDHQLAVLLDTGGRVRTGAVTSFGPARKPKGAFEVHTSDARYTLEVLRPAPSSQTPRRPPPGGA